jgi:hypothetical protein
MADGSHPEVSYLQNPHDGTEAIDGITNHNKNHQGEKSSSSKFYFLELSEDDLKRKIYLWFVEDGYIFDLLAAGLIIAINSLVALEAVLPIHR